MNANVCFAEDWFRTFWSDTLLFIFTFFENKNISLLSIYEDPSSEKICGKLFELIERNI